MYRGNALLEDGYTMIQYSVYARACVTQERIATHSRRIQKMIPPDGSVRCLFVTNIQWDKMFVFHGRYVLAGGAVSTGENGTTAGEGMQDGSVQLLLPDRQEAKTGPVWAALALSVLLGFSYGLIRYKKLR